MGLHLQLGSLLVLFWISFLTVLVMELSYLQKATKIKNHFTFLHDSFQAFENQM